MAATTIWARSCWARTRRSWATCTTCSATPITVHVRLGETGEIILDSVIKGDTVREVLNYVQFSSDALVSRLRRDVETALREGRLGYEESGRLLKFYEEGLHGYTYLDDVHEQ